MLRNLKFFAIIFAVVTLILLTILPGVRVANDFPYVSTQTVASQLGFPQSWGVQGYGLGEYRVATLWTWPLDSIYALGSNLQIDFSVLTKLIGIAGGLTIAIFSIYKFLSYYKFDKKSRIVGTIVFITSTYFILLVSGGQLSVAAAFGLLPVVFIAFDKSVTSSQFSSGLVAGIGVSVLGYLDIRFVYLLGLVLALRSVFCFRFFGGWIRTGAISLLVFLGLHAYWILPSILIKAPALPNSYISLSAVQSLSFTDSSHALFSQQPQWWQNIFGQIQNLNPFFVIFPLLAFLAPAVSKRKEIGFFLVLGVLGVFLAKGNNPPFGSIYQFLFTKIPGFSLFRDSTKFFIFVTLAYSFLIAATVESLKKFSKRTYLLFTIFIVAYAMLLINPLWKGKLSGIFSYQSNAQTYIDQGNVIANDNTFGRSLWIPTRGLFGYSSDTHPLIEATRLLDHRAFLSGTVGSYETLNFLRESPYVGQLLNVLSVKYIAYPDINGSDEQIKYHSEFLNQLRNLPWIGKTLTDSPANLLQTKQSQDHIFSIPNLAYIVGSERIYWPLSQVSNFDLAKLALVFSQNTVGKLTEIEEYPTAKVILYQASLIDAAAELINFDHVVFPAKSLNVSPDANGWWKRDGSDLIPWRTFLQEKYKLDSLAFDYGGGWAVAEGQKTLNLKPNNVSKDMVLLARVMKSNKGSSIEFSQNDQQIGIINTYNDTDKINLQLAANSQISQQNFEYGDGIFNWYEVGKLINNSPIQINTKGYLNVINAIAVIDKSAWRDDTNKISEWQNNGRLLLWENLSEEQKRALFESDSNVDVRYQQINQSHYQVIIPNIDTPKVVVFSDSYDPLWQMRGKNAFKLFDLINGFYITQPGTYDLFYSPQKYLDMGTAISAVFITFIILFYILKLKRKK